MKNKILLCLVFAIVGQNLFAQTQQGYVKTLGRPDKAGEPLSGVTVRVKGEHNTTLSEADGTFSMLMPDKKNGDAYTLQQVQKNGYELNEADIIGRQFAFSDKVPLTIVMVSSEQLQADKQRIENNAYKTAEKNYKAKYDLLEKQLADNEITIEQYRTAIQDLQDKFEKYQSLIDGLAEHYAHTDYDELDEKDREINICIENGDLERADSLIHTLFDPIGVLQRNKEALDKLDMQIDQANELLTQANEDMAAVLKQQEKDAEYLYQLYTIALARYDNEKAGQYIETRALLDTTNATWQFEAGLYLSQQNDFEKAEKHYLRALNIYDTRIVQDSLPTLEIEKAYTLNNLSVLYSRMHTFSKSESLLLEAYDLCKHISKQDSTTYPPYSLIQTKLLTISNLGSFYLNTNRYAEAGNWMAEGADVYEKYMKSAPQHSSATRSITMYFIQILYNLIELCDSGRVLSSVSQSLIEQINLSEFMEIIDELQDDIVDVPEYYGPAFSRLCYTISKLYTDPQHQTEREKMLRFSLDIYRQLAKNNPQAFEPDLVAYINYLAEFYSETNRPTESEALYKESLEITRRLAKENPQAYTPTLSGNLYSIGAFYIYSSRFSESEQLLREALEIEQDLIKKDSSVHTLSYAQTLNILALALSYEGKIAESESLYLESIELYSKNIHDRADSLVVMTSLAGSFYNLATLYRNTNRIQEGIYLYEEAIEINRSLVKIQNSEELESGLVQSLCEVASLYLYVQQYDNAKSAFDEALEIEKRLSAKHPGSYESLMAFTLNNYANYNSNIGNYQESQNQFEEALKIYRKLSKEYPDYPLPQLVSCLIDYSGMMYLTQQHHECESLLEEAIQTCRQSNNKGFDEYTSLLAESLLRLGHIKAELQQYSQAMKYAEECHEISNQNKDNNLNFLDIYISSAELLSNIYSSTKEHHKAYQILNEIIPALKTMYLDSPELWKERYVAITGGLSFNVIFLKDYPQAEQYATEALTIDPSQQWIFSNLAAALLFQGKYAEAEEIYRSFKDDLKNFFLQDFDDFEAAGVIPEERKADVERIRTLLNERN